MSRFQIKNRIRLIELFAGIGCQAMALKRVTNNFEHYRVCDFDRFAVTSYNGIHGTDFTATDICDLTADDLGIVDTDKFTYIMTYSYPCTDLSIAGKQAGMAEGSGTRSSLLWEVLRLLRECKELPQVLLMENVPEVCSRKNQVHWIKLLKELNELGYKNFAQNLKAQDFGVPQSRERTFMVSILDGLGDYIFPKPFKLTKHLKDVLETNIDEKYYLPTAAVDSLTQKYTGIGSRQTKSKSLFSFQASTKSHNDLESSVTESTTESVTVVGRVNSGPYANLHDIARRVYSPNGLLPSLHTCSGGNSEPLVLAMRGRPVLAANVSEPCSLRTERNEYAKSIRKDYENGVVTEQRKNMQQFEPRFDGIVNTLTTVSKDNLILEPNYRIRKLTELEMWRLMDISDEDFYKAKSNLILKIYNGKDKTTSQLRKCAGNGIVIGVLEHIFKQMISEENQI